MWFSGEMLPTEREKLKCKDIEAEAQNEGGWPELLRISFALLSTVLI